MDRALGVIGTCQSCSGVIWDDQPAASYRGNLIHATCINHQMWMQKIRSKQMRTPEEIARELIAINQDISDCEDRNSRELGHLYAIKNALEWVLGEEEAL